MAQELIYAQIEPSFCIFEKFKSWEKESKSNSLILNTTICCELIEANASLQHELFKILRFFVAQGSLCTENNNQFSGMHVEPSVGKSYSSPTVFTEYNSHQQSLRGHSNLHPAKYDSDITVDHYKSLPRLENEILERLIQSQIQCDRLANQLEAQNMEFIQPCIENKFTQKRPRAMVDSENVLGPSITDFSPKPQVNAPRYFTDYTDHAQESDNSYVPNNDPAKSVNNANVLGFEDDDSITRLKDVFQSWLSPLVGRYNELFTNLRVACMRRLESFGQSDCARNQRLIFHAVQAGFTVTSNVIRRLPVSVQQENYLSRNSSERQLSVLNTSLTTDQIEKLVAATFRRLSRHPPPECACHATISAISGTSIKRPISIRRPVTSQELNALDNLLREVCSLAWHLLAEKHGSNGIPSVWYADVDKTAKPGDTYNDKCYRRSYDSDPSAGQVHHYIWPCLILYSKGPIDIQQQYQSKNVGITNKYNIVKSYVLVKGEACTRNPVHAASQKDKAAALLNHEFSCHGVCRSTSPQIYYRSRSTSVRRV
ncbi:hypothetical protein MN116_005906 [Schistosoma mekongi]|uniref:Mitochondria-eating protein n=1 Tax=Schistosoma mekongi TaxID=38744 RepID=A0AAE1ZAJ7_SCHME|nr:hypothetical protein MN116_005906 [Schistosoma mekongi]